MTTIDKAFDLALDAGLIGLVCARHYETMPVYRDKNGVVVAWCQWRDKNGRRCSAKVFREF